MVSLLATEGLIFYYPETDVSLLSLSFFFEKISPPLASIKINYYSIPSSAWWMIEESMNTTAWIQSPIEAFK